MVSDMPVLRIVLLVAIVAGACGGAGTEVASRAPSFDRAAAEYAASAERAIAETAYVGLAGDGVSELVSGLCENLGIGAVWVTIDGLGIDASDGDQQILAEVLATGVRQVCPDRAPIDLAGIYLAAVAAAVDDAGSGVAYNDAAVLAAAPVVCPAFEAGGGFEAAALAVVVSLYGVDAGSLEDLEGEIDASEGFVAGAVVTAATALLCPEWVDELDGSVEGS